MGRSAVEARLREIIVEYMEIDGAKITSTANLVSDLGLESLDRLELLMLIEDKFSIALHEEVAEQIVDFSSLVDCVIAALGPWVIP